MDYGVILTNVLQDADEAGVPVEKFLKSVAVAQKRQAAEEAARRSTAESKSRLEAHIAQMDGTLLDGVQQGGVKMKDICEAAGVRINQGNSSYARHLVKHALLTYRRPQ